MMTSTKGSKLIEVFKELESFFNFVFYDFTKSFHHIWFHIIIKSAYFSDLLKGIVKARPGPKSLELKV